MTGFETFFWLTGVITWSLIGIAAVLFFLLRNASFGAQ